MKNYNKERDTSDEAIIEASKELAAIIIQRAYKKYKNKKCCECE
jgi:hypothetical protein